MKRHFKNLSVLVAHNSMSLAQKFPSGLLVGLAQAVNVAGHFDKFRGRQVFQIFNDGFDHTHVHSVAAGRSDSSQLTGNLGVGAGDDLADRAGFFRGRRSETSRKEDFFRVSFQEGFSRALRMGITFLASPVLL